MEKSERSVVEQLSDNLMTAVPKDFFFEGMALPVTTYVRMAEAHYLVIGKRYDKANFSSLRSFNNPNFRIFVKTSDHSVLIQYLTDLTGKVVSQSSVPASVKSKFMSGLIDDAIGAFEYKNFTSTVQLERISGFLIQLGSSSPGFDEIIQLLEELPASESKHSMATCLVALSICEEMRITHGVAHEKVAMACLLHDIGLKMIPREILDKPRHRWTAEERAIYELHPTKGVELLRNVKDISNDILIMIAEHHENSQGTGFPKKIRDVKISPLGKIVIVANGFSELLFPSNAESRIYNSDEAIEYIDEILGQPFNKGAFSALKTIINKRYLASQQGKA